MEIHGLTGVVFRTSEWLIRLVYINIIWFFSSLIGLVIFGFFPSTFALFAIVRKWIMGQKDFPIFKTFWKFYKYTFIKANLIGFGYLIIGLVLYIDLLFFQTHEGSGFILGTYFFKILFIIYLLSFVYLFPVFVHYDFRKIQYFKQPLLILLLCPIESILVIMGLIIFYYLLFLLPEFTILLGMGLIAYFIMRVTYKGFRKIEVKKRTIQ